MLANVDELKKDAVAHGFTYVKVVDVAADHVTPESYDVLTATEYVPASAKI